jgi:ankyrin repeat protein
MDFDLTSSSFFPNPNRRDMRGFAAIHYLAAIGDYEGMKRLASSAGANPRVTDKSGNTCLHWAVKNGHMNLVHSLLQSAPDLVNMANAEGETPLLNAARNGDDDNSLRIAMLLLRSGASVDQQDQNGLTALHCAVADGNDRMVRLLLQSKADPRLATLEDSLTPLHFAAIYNRPASARLLSQTGVSVDMPDDEGETPLLWAYRFAATQCMLVLLALGANIAIANSFGETATDFEASKLVPSPDVVPPIEDMSSVFDPSAMMSLSNEMNRGALCGSPAQRSPYFNSGVFVQQ